MKADRLSIIHNALAHRGSKAEDFSAFVTQVNRMGKPKEADHSANLSLLKGGFQ